jgi:hypothetical protein
MSWIKSISKMFIPLIIVVLGLEFGARQILIDPNLHSRNFSSYSEVELDRSLPFINEQNGEDCVTLRDGFHWNQWWGFSARILHLECAKEFFSGESFNVVFMGGSAMFNAEAPNYLTVLDYLATRNIDNLKSINLSESGARHMNMAVRFQREVLPLKPDLVIFFDGFNEFNSIVYGGDPSDDFYWTATGNVRMHQPARLYIDKAIELSSFFELALLHSGVYRTSRNVFGISAHYESIHAAVDTYVRDKQVTSALCNAFDIKCLFVIQPQVYGSPNLQHLQIISSTSRTFPHAKEIRTIGYEIILERCSDCIDMSRALDEIDNSFIDPVHFSKAGSQILGMRLERLIRENLD